MLSSSPAHLALVTRFAGLIVVGGLLGLALRRVSRRSGQHMLRLAAIVALLLQFILPYLHGPAVPVAQAAPISVTTTNDDNTVNGNCTLREAIIAANTNTATDACAAGNDINDTINLPAGTYVLTLTGAGEDFGATGDLDIRSELTIAGAGAATTIIDGNDLDRVLHITGTNAAVNISNVTIQNGSSTGDGGGIFNASAATLIINTAVISDNVVTGAGEDGGGIANTGGGTVNITGSTIANNRTTAPNGSGANGGGIFNSQSGSTLNVTDSFISGNTTVDSGGGIYTAQPMSITGSTITGNSTISGTGGGIDISQGAVVTLDTVIISSNNSSQGGGGISTDSNSTVVTILNSTISSNTTANGDGGGVANRRGTVSISDSTISDNESTLDDGGGVANSNRGTVNISNSTISGNTAADNGGGVFNTGSTTDNSTVTVTSSTISGNLAADRGGGVFSDLKTNLTNTTVSGNSAPNGGGVAADFSTARVTLNNVTAANNMATTGGGGGIYRGPNGGGGVFTLTNSIIAANNGTFPDCRDEGGAPSPATLVSQGTNLIGNSNGCSGLIGSDVTNVNPLLGSLQNNGGDTQTHALLVGSPAVDAGNDATCAALDQRGTARADQAGVGTSLCDIGAYEFSPVSVPNLNINNTSVTEGNSGTVNAVFDVTLSASGPTTATVAFATSDGTATTGDNDYVATSGTLTFAPGQTQKQITVVVNGDTKAGEEDENFSVILSNPSWATIATGQGTGTIVNDDVGIAISNVTVTEGDTGTTPAVFAVTLSKASAGIVTVDYSTSDAGTAKTTDNDYVAKSGKVTFTSGVTTQNVTILVNGDTKAEPDETFLVSLSNPTGGAGIIPGKGVGQGTILDDDVVARLYLPAVFKK